MCSRDYAKLEADIGYVFKDKSLLELAMMHKSYENEQTGVNTSNQRLEFLGDAVISLVCAELAYKEYPDLQEGSLTRMRSSLVCTHTLSKYAKRVSLQKYILMGVGEKMNSKQECRSYKLLEDTFEALCAAIYLDGGMDEAWKFVSGMMLEDIKTFHFEHMNEIAFHDYKSLLQNKMQKEGNPLPLYTVVKQSGPDHRRKFTVEVQVRGRVYGVGTGTSRKNAEQSAAQKALAAIENEDR